LRDQYPLKHKSHSVLNEGKDMVKWSSAGLALIVIGLLLWIAYGLYQGFEEVIDVLDVVTGFVAGLIIVGVCILFISIIIEQRRETKKIREKIKKEDLEP